MHTRFCTRMSIMWKREPHVLAELPSRNKEVIASGLNM
jgi:hypothetical protein